MQHLSSCIRRVQLQFPNPKVIHFLPWSQNKTRVTLAKSYDTNFDIIECILLFNSDFVLI